MKKYATGIILLIFVAGLLFGIWKISSAIFGLGSRGGDSGSGAVSNDKPIGDPKVEKLSDLAKKPVESCPEGMVNIGKKFCIDKYEYPNAKGEKPKIKVSWDDAADLCKSQGKRLCMGDEWEMACKGPEGYAYSYANVPDVSKCNVLNLGKGEALPSGSLEGCKSGYGVYDMIGNVSEWTGLDKSASTTRGCGWDCNLDIASCNVKSPSLPNSKSIVFGVRCCK